MPNKSFCFIMHVENEALAQTSIESIRKLSVPEGYTVDLITFSNTKNTVRSYDAAAKQCEAEYKVFLRDTVKILSPQFLPDIVSIFESDESLGVVGMLGCIELLPCTKIEHGLWGNKGIVGSKLLVSANGDTVVRYASGMTDVKSISDYLFIVRNNAADFNLDYTRAHHAVLQLALDTLQNGYRVVVPAQTSPWIAVYNIENANDLERFDAEKQLFLQNNKDMFPPVGIGIPTYNRPEWLVDTINSVVNQGYPNMRVFITDNSRNEETATKIIALFSGDSRVSYEHNSENIGAFDNFTKVYNKLNTEYCSTITDDMWLMPNAIERAMDYYILDVKGEISAITGHSRAVNHDSGEASIYASMDQHFKTDTIQHGDIWAKICVLNNMTIFSFCGLFRKSKLNVPFGFFGARKGFANFDRYVGYELHKVGLSVYLASAFTSSWVHSEQLEWRAEYRIGGGNDLAYEALESRNCGFLPNDADYLHSLRSAVTYYDRFALKCEVIGDLPESYQYLLDEAYIFIRKLHNEIKQIIGGSV
jgi:glycosyltransferase involved in cell wall biosynthesis